MLGAFEKLSPKTQISILNAAANVFAEEGYHYASISNICRKAGVSNGALYKYFKNKESLFFSVLDYSVLMVETELYKKYIVDGKSMFDAIYNFLRGLEQFTKDFGDYVSIYCDLGSSSMNRFAATTSDKYRRATSSYTVKMVEGSKKRGEIDSNIRNESAAFMIDSYITFFAYSLVSEYHSNRFDSFFTTNGKTPSKGEKITLIVESLKQALKK